MAVFITLNPGITAQELREALMDAIQTAHIDTWEYHPTTGFVHTAVSRTQQQWNQGAYLAYGEAATATDTVVKLYYRLTPSSTITANTYGTLNGRFAGMLLNHFKRFIKSIQLVDLRTP